MTGSKCNAVGFPCSTHAYTWALEQFGTCRLCWGLLNWTDCVRTVKGSSVPVRNGLTVSCTLILIQYCSKIEYSYTYIHMSWGKEWWLARGRRVVQTWLGDCRDPYMILRPQLLGLHWSETQCIACMLVYSYVCILLLCFVYYFNVNYY